MDWDQPSVSSANLGLVREDDEVSIASDVMQTTTRVEAQSKFRQFLRTFHNDNQVYHYREQLKAHYDQGDYYFNVNLDDLRAFDSQLMQDVRQRPAEMLGVLEAAALEVVSALTVPRPKVEDMQLMQAQMTNFPRFTEIRRLSARDVSRLVCVRGIVVSAGRTHIKATTLSIMCRNCEHTRLIKCGAGFGGATLPRRCDSNVSALSDDSGLGKCPLDPYVILADSSKYIDQQRLKLQEAPETVPTGEMPRHISLALDRYLVDTVKPGTRITVVGIYTTFKQDKGGRNREKVGDVGVRIPYMRVLGIFQEDKASDLLTGKFDAADIEQIKRMSRTADLYQKIARSVAPALYGHEDIKRAIACMLFGGARKHLPDGMRLRGDINVLLLGDPSCGKSQFLKFAVQAAPIGVYTSGKGSSAAGLTASVIRDPSSGQFQLEGGALVLADGGLVCIDEFDKMREQDRVAIHEAMEQQTISIAKAGITTILNSRTSVLAAANPIFGRYDDMKSPTENIDFQTTILSRFDLIFIVRDIQNIKRDIILAKYIINVHKMRDQAKQQEDLVEVNQLKKYIAYARFRCNPRLSDEASEMLNNRYVAFRNTMRERKKEMGASAIPITVRQLEAIVRLSESLARMELATVATVEHVKEALRLFQVSTLQAATSNFGEGIGTQAFAQLVKRAEQFLERRVAINASVSVERIRREMTAKGHQENAVLKAMDLLVQRTKFRYKRQRKLLQRVRA